MWGWKTRYKVLSYERTELHGSVLHCALDGHGWVLHCSRSGGLSWISQLRSVKRSPLGRWHATNLVFIPPPHGLVHWRQQEEKLCFTCGHEENWASPKWVYSFLSVLGSNDLMKAPALCCVSYLSPVAIDPLWTRPWLAGLLLVGPAAILTVVGSVAILILAHHYTPLETSCTSTGALLSQSKKNEHGQIYYSRKHMLSR